MKALNDKGELDPELISVDRFVSISITEDAENPDKNKAVVFGESDKDADFIVMLDKDFEGTEEDYLYGVVTDKPSKSGGSYYATINVFGEGEKDYKIADPAKFAKGDVVAFDFNNKDEAVLKSAKISTGKTLTEYDDGYVTISDSVYKVDSAAILYNKDSDGDLDKKISRSKLKDYEGKVIDFAIDDNIIVAAVVYDGEKPDNGDGDVDAGKVTYIINNYLDTFNTPRLVLEDISEDEVTKNIASFDAWFFGDADNTVEVSEEAMVAWLTAEHTANNLVGKYVDVTEDNELVVTVTDASDEAENANVLIGIYIVSNDAELLAALGETNLDTIVLATGETFNGFTVDIPVTITGDAVVKGSITVNANDVVLKDFAMEDYTLNSGGRAILVNGDRVKLMNLTFNSFNRPDNKTQEILVEGSEATIKDVVVNRGQEIVSGNPAIQVNNVPMAIEGNIVDAAIAFQVGTSTENVVKNNTIRRAWAEGIWFYSNLDDADTQQLVNVILDENTVENYGEVNAAHPVKGQSSTGNWFFAGDEVTP